MNENEDHLIHLCEVIFMSFIKKTKHRLSCVIRSELARIDFRCVIAGAVIILLCGFLSALAGGSAAYYRELERPRWAPPAFLFPIVWTVLYILIGGAAGAITCVRDRSLESEKLKGLLFFVIMMVFNFIWSPLFFAARAFFAAFVAIVMMIILTFFIICFFGRIYKVTAAVMVLYLAWLFFAAYLNLAIIILN